MAVRSNISWTMMLLCQINLAGSKEPVDTDAVLRLFRRYEGELFA
jgi:hypothetical protein